MDREITFERIQHLGTINTCETGWTKEVNIISWNGGVPKIDIREWSPEHDRMSRGITLHMKEAERLADYLKDYME